MVFEDKKRTSQDRKFSFESHYEFLDRSGWESIAAVRKFINDCWSNYPESEKAELCSRLKSRENHRSAAFEILLHESLLKLGCELEHHPDLGIATSPDFLVNAPDGSSFIVEAVLASEVNDLLPSVEAIKNQFFDRLDSKPHPDFRIEIRDCGAPSETPSVKKISKQILTWLGTLDYESLKIQFEESNFEEMPCYECNLKGWQLRIRPMPVTEERRGKTNNLIGFLPTRGGIINSWEPLRDVLVEKNGKYGEMQLPLVIAVNFGRFYLSEIDEIQALYGSEKIMYSGNNPGIDARIVHEPNGAWMGPNGPQCTRTSGAWFFADLNWFSAGKCSQTFHTNPWANINAPEFLKQFPNCALSDDGSILRKPGVSIGSILELQRSWPE